MPKKNAVPKTAAAPAPATLDPRNADDRTKIDAAVKAALTVEPQKVSAIAKAASASMATAISKAAIAASLKRLLTARVALKRGERGERTYRRSARA